MNAPYRMNKMTSADPASAPADAGPADAGPSDADKARDLLQQLSDVIEHWAGDEQGEQTPLSGASPSGDQY